MKIIEWQVPNLIGLDCFHHLLAVLPELGDLALVGVDLLMEYGVFLEERLGRVSVPPVVIAAHQRHPLPHP